MKPMVVVVVVALALLQWCIVVRASMIQSTCRNTPNYGLCMATLRGSTATDITGLALVAVHAVQEKTKEAIFAVKRLKLRECARAYNAVLVGDVPQAVAALTEGDPKFAENGMADAAVEADVCMLSAPASLKMLNKQVRELAQVARAIIRNLL